MGKYTTLQTNVFSIFGTAEWEAEEIKTVPANFTGTTGLEEFIRVSIIPNGTSVNIWSISGVIIIDIFSKAGEGPKRAFAIADVLDTYLVGQSLAPFSNVAVQFKNSSFTTDSIDSDNPTLFRSTYSIPFTYTEVQ